MVKLKPSKQRVEKATLEFRRLLFLHWYKEHRSMLKINQSKYVLPRFIFTPIKGRNSLIQELHFYHVQCVDHFPKIFAMSSSSVRVTPRQVNKVAPISFAEMYFNFESHPATFETIFTAGSVVRCP